jgi:hypothetical protein
MEFIEAMVMAGMDIIKNRKLGKEDSTPCDPESIEYRKSEITRTWDFFSKESGDRLDEEEDIMSLDDFERAFAKKRTKDKKES